MAPIKIGAPDPVKMKGKHQANKPHHGYEYQQEQPFLVCLW